MRTEKFIYDDHSVTWPNIEQAQEDLSSFEKLIETAKNENELHEFLLERQYLLAWQEPHCHHVVSKPRLGSQYVPDFLLAEMSSAGITWVLVEIERSDDRLTTKSGEFTKCVRTALQQIRDWRRWLTPNKDYAIRSLTDGGLGLGEVEMLPKGLVVVGRRAQVDDRFNQLRSDTRNEGIEICTYDRILEWAKHKAGYFGAGPRALGLKSSS
jgi:hypothetical protein